MCVIHLYNSLFNIFFDLLILPFNLGYKGQKSVLSWFVELFRLNFKSQIWQDGGGHQPGGSIRASPRSLRDPRRLCGETGRQRMSLQSPEYLWKNWEEADLMRRYFLKNVFMELGKKKKDGRMHAAHWRRTRDAVATATTMGVWGHGHANKGARGCCRAGTQTASNLWPASLPPCHHPLGGWCCPTLEPGLWQWATLLLLR